MPQQREGSSAQWIAIFVGLTWVVELANTFMDHRLNVWGLLPRTLHGLVGIPLSPFLHVGFGHLLLNTVPLIVLGGFVALQGRRVYLEVTAFVILVGGAFTWIFGRAAYHVGASGVVYGYFGYLVARGWYERSLKSILLALVTLFLYGGISWGLLPTVTRVSWEGHLFGLVAGIFAARLQGRERSAPAVE